MQPDEDAHGDVQYLAGSPQRVAILGALCEEPARPSDLSDRVDVTRTTVQRVLAGYRDRDWVVKCDGRYRPTVTGRFVHERYRDLLAAMERADEFAALAVHLGPVADGLPDEALEEGHLTIASDQDPLAAVDGLVEWIRDAEGDHLRAASPIVAQTFNEVGAELLQNGTTIDYVIDGEVLERSANEFEQAVERAISDGNIDVFVHPEPLAFGLAIRGKSACLSAYDEHNNLRAILVSDDPAVRGWASNAFARLRDDAEPLDDVLEGRG